MEDVYNIFGFPVINICYKQNIWVSCYRNSIIVSGYNEKVITQCLEEKNYQNLLEQNFVKNLKHKSKTEAKNNGMQIFSRNARHSSLEFNAVGIGLKLKIMLNGTEMQSGKLNISTLALERRQLKIMETTGVRYWVHWTK